MIEQRGSSASVIVGSSVHNTRIERLWRDVRKSVVDPVRVTLFALEEEGILDPDNEVDLYCVHQAFKERINLKLSEFCASWNNHPLRSEYNYTPLQLFHSYGSNVDFIHDDNSTVNVAVNIPTNGNSNSGNSVAVVTPIIPDIRDHVVVSNNRFNPFFL